MLENYRLELFYSLNHRPDHVPQEGWHKYDTARTDGEEDLHLDTIIHIENIFENCYPQSNTVPREEIFIYRGSGVALKNRTGNVLPVSIRQSFFVFDVRKIVVEVTIQKKKLLSFYTLYVCRMKLFPSQGKFQRSYCTIAVTGNEENFYMLD